MSIRTNMSIFIMIPLIIICTLFSLEAYFSQRKTLLQGVDQKLETAARMAKAALPPDYHDLISGMDSVSQPAYLQIVDKFNRICTDVELQYIWSNLKIGDDIYFTTATSPSKDIARQDHSPFFERHNDPEAFKEAFSTMNPVVKEFRNEWGNGRMILIPFFDKQKRQYCFGASMGIEAVENLLSKIVIKVTIVVAIILIAGVFACYFFARAFSKPIMQLTRFAKDIANGHSIKAIQISGTTELVSLGQSIEMMNHSIHDKIKVLQESEDRYKTLFRNNPSVMVIIDPLNTKIVDANSAAVAFYGWSLKDFTTKKMTDINILTEEEIFQKMQQVKEHKLQCFYFQHRLSNGDVRDVEVYSGPIKLDSRKLLILVIQDITKRILAEKALKESEKRLITAGKAAYDLIYEWDVASSGLKWYGDIDGLLGYGKGEISRDITAWINLIHPDDAGNLENAVEIHTRSTHPIKYEYRIMHKDGTYRYWNEHALPLLNDKGLPYRWIGVCTDNTEARQVEKALQKSEEKYRTMMESMKDAVYICSSDYKIEYMNRSMVNLIGNEATGELCHKAIYNADNRCAWCDMDQVQQGEYVEYEMVNPQNERHYSIASSPVNTVEGNISKLTIYHDITDRKEMEKHLLQAQKMEAIGTLAGGIAHDFNNVLFSMIGFIELAMEDVLHDSLAYNNLKEALIGAQRAKKMVKQILTFSSESGDGKKSIRIQSVIKEAITLLKNSIPSTIKIQHNMDMDFGPVLADSTKIHQLIMNLSTNAYYAMRKKGGVLELHLNEEEIGSGASDLDLDPGLYLKLTISDTGHGMENKTLKKIFDPYFSTKGPGKGTGMGLAVVYGIIKDLGGDIKVSSKLEEGTVFHVYLPRIQARHVEQKSLLAEADLTGTEHILHIDDEKHIVHMIQQALKRRGYQVTSHTNPLEALNDFKANPDEYDLVITDMTMPDLTGAQLARKLKTIRPDIPLIIFTGFSDMIDEDKAKDMGFSAYIMKPIFKDKIAITIRKVLDKKKENK